MTGTLLTDLVGAIVALGNPENWFESDLYNYTNNLENLLCDTYGFNIIDETIIEVDDHGEALHENVFGRKEDRVVIGYQFRHNPEWGITSVYKPYFMKPQVVTTYVFDKPVF